METTLATRLRSTQAADMDTATPQSCSSTCRSTWILTRLFLAFQVRTRFWSVCPLASRSAGQQQKKLNTETSPTGSPTNNSLYCAPNLWLQSGWQTEERPRVWALQVCLWIAVYSWGSLGLATALCNRLVRTANTQICIQMMSLRTAWTKWHCFCYLAFTLLWWRSD